MELGCGQGYGIELILDRFGAAAAHGIDLDEAMVRKARARLSSRGSRASVGQASATAIPAGDGAYDAVFDFGVIHHVQDWRRALAEVHRVLRPDGRFYFEEVTAHALARLSYRVLFRHPTTDRFSGDVLVAELGRQGFHLGDRVEHRFFGDFVFGVAQRL